MVRLLTLTLVTQLLRLDRHVRICPVRQQQDKTAVTMEFPNSHESSDDWISLATGEPEFARESLLRMGLNGSQADEVAAIVQDGLDAIEMIERRGTTSIEVEGAQNYPVPDPERFIDNGYEAKQQVRDSTWAKLRNWLTETKTVPVQGEKGKWRSTEIDVPIFRVAAPNVEGCSVALERSVDSRATRGVSVKVLGTGFEGTRVTRVTDVATTKVGAGEVRDLIMPVAIRYRTSQLLVRGKAGEPFVEYSAFFHPQMQAAPKEIDDPGHQTLGALLAEYPFDRSPLGEIQTPKRSGLKTDGYAVSAGLDTDSASISLSCRVERVSTIGLDPILIGGNRYRMHELRDRPGIGWDVTSNGTQ